eukprot:6004566-Pyramimonas_sp.AAC.1
MPEVYDPVYPTASRLKRKGALDKHAKVGLSLNCMLVSNYVPMPYPPTAPLESSSGAGAPPVT